MLNESKVKKLFKPILILFISAFIFSVKLKAETCLEGNENFNGSSYPRFEHLEINVADPQAVVKWYVDNMSFKIIRQSGAPTFNTFVADSGMNMMLELGYNEEYPVLDFSKFDHNSIHLAFSCTNISEMKSKLTAKGATIAEDLRKTDSGDQFLVLRDPWGLPIQFAQRAKSMLNHPGLAFEHLAINNIDSRQKAKWFVENLGFKVMKEGGEPDYGIFVSDNGGNMMLELYQKKDFPVINFNDISHMSIHLAFVVNNVENMKAKLLATGATLAADITITPGGDSVVTLRDPWGQPIQFVKRSQKMLK